MHLSIWYEWNSSSFLGIDPGWQYSLDFTNSFKMKLSVIIAYLQMSLGLVLSALNYAHSKNFAGIIFKFIPQFLFLSCIFGYMDFLIVYKWLQPWKKEAPWSD